MAELRIETPAAGVRLLVISRDEKRNALSPGLIEAIRVQLDAAEQEEIRALVVASEGGVFSAGADLTALKGDSSDLAFDEAMAVLTSALMASPLISFVAIQGACIGAALDFALACDFRMGSIGASFSLPAARLGILYNPRRLAELLRVAGPATARRLLLLAEVINLDEAYRCGIVTHRADHPGPDGALQTALEYAKRAVLIPALAQRTAKAFLMAAGQPGYDEAYWQERRLALLASDERAAAFQQMTVAKK